MRIDEYFKLKNIKTVNGITKKPYGVLTSLNPKNNTVPQQKKGIKIDVESDHTEIIDDDDNVKK